MSMKPTYEELERRVAELEQQVGQYQSEAVKYKTLFNSFPHGITVSDTHGRIVETNAAAEHLLGVEKTEHEKREIDGKEWRIIRADGSGMPPNEWASVVALKENRVVSNCEMGIVKSQNETTWINVTAAPLSLENHGVVVTYSDISELKQAKESLIKNEKRYKDAQRIGKVGNWEYDIPTEKFWGSDEAKRIYGFDPASREFSTDEVENCIPERKRVHQALVDLIENDKPYDLEFEIHPLTGPKRKVIQSVAELFRDDSGTPLKVVGVIQDVTERKDAESAFVASQKQLKEHGQILSAILDHTHMMAVFLDVKFNFIWVNQAYADTCKKPVSFFPGKNHFDLYPHEENRAIFEGVVETGQEFFVAAKPFQFPDQPERGLTYWDWSLKPVKDEKGKIAGLVFTLAEVTERIQAELALRQSEAKFRTLVNQAPAALFLHDLDGRIVDVNQNSLKKYGYTREQLLQMTAKDIDPDYIEREDDGKFWDELEKVKKIDFEARHRKKDGSIFPVKISLSPIMLGNEKHIFALAVDMTEQKQALEKLQNSEEMFRTVFEQAAVGVAQLSSSGSFLKMNSKFCQIVGYEKDELFRLTFRDITHPEDLYLDETHIAKVLAGKIDTFEIEKRYKHKSGDVIWIQLFSSAVRDATGNVKYAVAVITDITKQKKAEMALRESEERFRLAYQTSPDSINLNRLHDGMFIDINEGFTKIMGYTKEDVIGKSSLLLNIWDNSEERKNLTNMLQKTGYVQNLEARFVAKDGSIKDGLMSARIIQLNGEDTIISITRDITERKGMEEYLHFLSSITEGVSDSIVVTDTNFNIIYSNKAAEDLFGYPLEELRGLHPSIFDAEKNVNGSQQELYEALSKGETFHGESLSKRKGGGTFYCEYKAMPLRSKQGELNAYVFVQRDVTDRKQMEEQIRQAQKMESIGTLAGGIAHDFNNILFPIVGMAEILLEDLQPGSIEHENAAEIYKAAVRGSKLVKQILAFSRQSEHKMIPMRIQQVLKEVLKLSRATIPADIEIVQKIQSDCGLVLADTTQIHQVAMNLITNAYHAVEEEGGQITVSLHEMELKNDYSDDGFLKKGKYARLTVSDTGCGIRPELVEHIFDPYFTTKEQGKGTGLGLAVVYGIVKKHGGDIKLLSEVDKGTVFNVYLPLMKKTGETVSGDREHGKVLTGTEHILMVDDEEAVVTLEKRILERLGYQVTMRTSSIEALEAFENDPEAFDLVITDMTMPYLTGDKLARRLIEIKPTIPVIICTGFSERIDKEKASEIGIKGFLMKPIAKTEMAEMVRKVLDEMHNHEGN